MKYLGYKIANKIDVMETEQQIESFEMKNKASIAQNRTTAPNPGTEAREKCAYIIEEYKRLAKRRIKRERIIDEYCRSYIDTNDFASRGLSYENEINSGGLVNNTNTNSTFANEEIKETKQFSYVPEKTNPDTFQFPQPIVPTMTA